MLVKEGFGGLLVEFGELGVIDVHGGIEAPDFLLCLVFDIVFIHAC